MVQARLRLGNVAACALRWYGCATHPWFLVTGPRAVGCRALAYNKEEGSEVVVTLSWFSLAVNTIWSRVAPSYLRTNQTNQKLLLDCEAGHLHLTRPPYHHFSTPASQSTNIYADQLINQSKHRKHNDHHLLKPPPPPPPPLLQQNQEQKKKKEKKKKKANAVPPRLPQIDLGRLAHPNGRTRRSGRRLQLRFWTAAARCSI
ncbi:hypothetical protein IWZ03DRAFT_181858 [Phyllosticta citriasiana]|uniref:Uncharacterized protein n=1 Tax=Phyllosticta citriasiana TaxID=595635 RepID=A0ABR1KMV1_9PEZI